MVVKATVDGSAVRQAIAELKEIDPKLFTALKKDLRSSMAGAASDVQNAWPNTSPLSGMANGSRTGYSKPGTSFSFTPGRPRRGGVSSLMAIRIKIPKNNVGAWIGEMAGLRNNFRSDWSREYVKMGTPMQHKLRGQGQAMVRVLNSRFGSSINGGRWGWKKFVTIKKDIRKTGLEILENAVEKMNRSQ